MEFSKITRRSFLAATAITGASAALEGSVVKGLVPQAMAEEKVTKMTGMSPEGETRIIRTCCRACIHNCGVLAHVRNGRVVKLEGDPEHPMARGAICAKCLAGVSAVYHPNRNKYPLLRVGKRGENKWKRITWSEAIDIIANKCEEVRRQYGAEAILLSTGGGGNPQFRSIPRAANCLGTPNWYEPGCAQCYLPRTLAYGIQYGGPSTSIADEAGLEIYNPDSPIKCLVAWGTDPSYSCVAGGGRAIVEMRARGVKIISIDPRFNAESSKADIWLPIRPGTDVALMLCWIKYIIDKNLYDHEFVMKWTNLPYLVNVETKRIVLGKEFDPNAGPKARVVWDRKTNRPQVMEYPWNDALDPELEGEWEYEGVKYKTGFTLLRERADPWTIEKASKVCWLDPKKVEEAILMYCDGPSGISLGVATDQYENSVQSAEGSLILNVIMGFCECPGSIMHRFPSANIAPANSMPPTAPKILPKGQLTKRIGSNDHKGLLQWGAGSPPKILRTILTGKPYPIKVWIDRSGNKFVVNGNCSAWVPAFDKLDLVVHMYMYPTSMSTYADILLPAREWLETDMLVESLNMAFVRQAVTHVWETENETLFWSKLVKRCAELGNPTAQKACDPEFMGKDFAYWDNMEELINFRLSPLKMKWEEFKQKAPVTFMPYDKWVEAGYYRYKKINPKTGLPTGFFTPSGKVEVYGDVYIELGRTGKPYALDELPPVEVDYDPLPWYAEPAESPNREIAKEYPLVLTQGRLPMYHHGTLRNIPYLREIYPVPELWINPDTARNYGITTGDWVWISSKRGRIRGKARLTEGIHPGVLYMERFWYPETLNTPTRGWMESSVNVLTKNDPPFNPEVGSMTLRGFQVKIEKADSAPEGIWQKPEDFKPWLPQPTDRTPDVKF